MLETKNIKNLRWLGNSKKNILKFPDAVKRTFGTALFFAQKGARYPDTKMMKGLGSGVYEILEDHKSDTYRAVYTVKFEKSSGNVFEDLGFENPEQELLKAKLAHCVHVAIQDKKLTQARAATLIGITQPDISKLKHGQYSRFSAERLFNFLNRLDYNVDITISKATDPEPHLNVLAH